MEENYNLTASERFLLILDRIEWLLNRIICFFLGCKLIYWKENEYITGYDCDRCSAGNDSMGNKSSYNYYDGNIIKRLFPRFWIRYFE